MVRYRVRPDALEEHLELLHAVFAELDEVRPEGMRWESFRMEDGVSFVELAEVDVGGRFSQLETWSAYRGTHDDRCDEPLQMVELERVAAYGLPPARSAP